MAKKFTGKEIVDTIQQLAEIYASQFEYAKRIDGQRYLRTKKDASISTLKLVRLVHKELDNDDCTYCFLFGILNAIAECDNIDTVDLDIYPTQQDVCNWLASDLRRSEYVHTSFAEYNDANNLNDFNIFEVLRQGYILELMEVFNIVKTFLVHRLGNIKTTNVD